MGTIQSVIAGLAAGVLLVFATNTSQAQMEQVAFAPGIFEINEKMRTDYDLWPQYSRHFTKAILQRDPQGNYLLAVTYTENRTTNTELYPLSTDELNALREKLAESPKRRDAGTESAVGGRYFLVTSATLMSIPQGIVLSNAFYKEYTVNEPWGQVTYRESTNFSRAMPFFLSAGAFGTSLLTTRDKPILSSAANMHLFGSAAGFGHGALTNLIVYGEDFYGQTGRYVILSGVSIAEGWAMYSVAKHNQFDYSRSMAWNSGNIWGGAAGLFTYMTLVDEVDDLRWLGVSGLAGSAAGILAMDQLYKKHYRTPGDYRAINALGLTGLTMGVAVGVDFDTPRAAGLSMLLGSATGIAIAYSATRQTEFSKVEGGLIALGTVVGGLLGGAVAILVEPDSYAAPVYMVAAGSGLGWLGTYSYFKKHDFGRNDTGYSIGNDAHIGFSVNPAGWLLARQISPAHLASGMPVQGLEAASVRIRF